MLEYIGMIVRIATRCNAAFCECFDAEPNDACLRDREGTIISAFEDSPTVVVELKKALGVQLLSIAQLKKVG